MSLRFRPHVRFHLVHQPVLTRSERIYKLRERREVVRAALPPLEREEQCEKGKLAVLRNALDGSDASGIVEDSVLEPVPGGKAKRRYCNKSVSAKREPRTLTTA
jgi:hypothetical protein